MNKEKKAFSIRMLVKMIVKPKQKEIPKNNIRPNHQPSWMYRNE